MSSFFGFYIDDVIRNKPDGEWDWDAPNLRPVYRRAESLYVEQGQWRPRQDAHLGVWHFHKRHLSLLRPGQGDAVERNQPFIDCLLLLEATYRAAAELPLDGQVKINRVNELFYALPENLTATIFGVPIKAGESQVIGFRKLLRLSLVRLSAVEEVPGAFAGISHDQLPRHYSSFTSILDQGIGGVRGDIRQQAQRCAQEVDRIRSLFLYCMKVGDVDVFPIVPSEE